MGTMSFQLPAGISKEAAQELQKACIAGGQDNMPWPTEVQIDSGRLVVRRSVPDSGCLAVPWETSRAGLVMGTTATLMERALPYSFLIELARGKINQVRCQAWDWQGGGLQVPAALAGKLRDASLSFGRAVTLPPSDLANQQAQDCLTLGYEVADQFVRLYIDQMFQARHQRQPRLDTALGCYLPAGLPRDQADALLPVCNSIYLPLVWKEVEPAEGSFQWEPYDAALAWAQAQGLAVTGGPLIDFSADRLPDWLWLWERDPTSLASFMCAYVETAVKRYRGRIHSWQLTTASNNAALLGLGEDEFLWLTVRLVEVARQVDSKLELVVGVAQPWGEYMAVEDRTHSPFIFADTLIRSGLNLGALDLELVMGVSPRGSYCRDLLEASRLIDLYSLLGVPLRLTLGYPSQAEPDPKANAAYKVGAGRWHEGFSPAVQADWAAAFAALALCKPSVRGVHWVHPLDAQPHQFPHCGLLDSQNKPKPVLQRLRALRENHLK